MARYHLTDDGPKVCSARIKCDYEAAAEKRGETVHIEHYPNKAAADAAYAKQLAAKHDDKVITSMRKEKATVEESAPISEPQEDEEEKETPVAAPQDAVFAAQEKAAEKARVRNGARLTSAGITADSIPDDSFNSFVKSGGFNGFHPEADYVGMGVDEDSYDDDDDSIFYDDGEDDDRIVDYYDDNDGDEGLIRYSGNVTIDENEAVKAYYKKLGGTAKLNSPEGLKAMGVIRKVLSDYGALDGMNYTAKVISHGPTRDDEFAGYETYVDMNAIDAEIRGMLA